jgi:Ca2+-binding EF-hand superfamily protein
MTNPFTRSLTIFLYRFVLLNLDDKVTGEQVEEMLQAADLDGDGAISYEEFVPMIMPGLKRMKEGEEGEEAEAQAP